MLVIHSFEEDYPAYGDFNDLISNKFKEEGIRAEIQTFYLNCEQYSKKIEEKRMYLYIDSIAQWKPDLILTYDDQASYTAMSCKHPYILTVPVVFAGVNFPNKSLLSEYPNVGGFWDKSNYTKNFQLIKQILGNTIIYMLHDSTYIDRQIKKEIHRQSEKMGLTVRENQTMYITEDELALEKIAEYTTQPDSSYVNIIPVQGDRLATIAWYMSKYAPYKHYLQAKRDYRVSNTSRFSSKPSFTAINEDLGYNSKLVGGYLTPTETLVSESVHRAAEILKGKPVSAFSQIQESAKQYVFDFNELEFWGIDMQLLPKDSVFINYPFYKKYTLLYWLMVSLTTGLIAISLCSLLIMYIREAKAKRKAQEDLLLEKESLAEALIKAEESDRMKSVFLASMSHEIRTPLNAIVGFSDIIAEMDLTEKEKKEYAQIIQTNNQLLLKLIDDVLDLASLESGHTTFTSSPYNLTELVNNLYSEYLLEMPEKVELRRKIPDIATIIETDGERLRQVMQNLVKNAIKFTTSGFIEIGYRCTPHQPEVELYVQDSGVGISPDLQKTIFERFRKLDDFTQGTGLGLSVCQAIMQQLQGKILLKSEKGKGSIFTVLLANKQT